MKQFKSSILVFGCASLITFSCSKKNDGSNLNPQYGPLVVTSSSVSVSLQGCQGSEFVSCKLSTTNFGSFTEGSTCSSGRFTATFTSGKFPFTCTGTWSGSATCSGDRTYEPIAPLSVTNAACPQ